MIARHSLLFGALTPLALLLSSHVAHASVVERVVAVVEDRAILLSELRERSQPFLAQLAAAQEAQRAAASSQLQATLLHRMVDEELEHRAAARAHITVTAQEIEDALQRVAQQNNITIEELIAEATKSGLTASDYREEIRRQLLESKLLTIKVQGRIRVTDEDTKALYHRLQLETRGSLEFSAAWIKIAVPSGASPDQVAAQRKLAETLATRATSGADFAELARTYSNDQHTREAGGALGALKPGSLPAAIDKALLALDVNGVAGPIRYRGDFYVLKLTSRAPEPMPTFEEAIDELHNRVYLEKLEQAKRRWLDGLRKQAHVEVRL
ncbi:MAG TPA: peptidylprolyl isomerase [Polyangiaceae bacterium]|nr:peptidylprolyl isomerase [Polyangiaceae bacterium]